MGEIDAGHLEHSFSSYKQVLQGLFSQIFYREGEKPEYTTERLSKWIQKVIIPQKKISSIRNAILNANSSN